jgi:serine/threonine protein kinase
MGHLHRKGIVYRDLKPENVMMGEDGYIQLADFGLAKNLQQNEKAFTFCGTPQYLAPEVIKEAGHTTMVDWWCLGILTYEMMVGFTPFVGGDSKTVYQSVTSKPVAFPDKQKHGISLSNECKDFIRNLLIKDPSKRLGSKGGMNQVMNHPWLSDISP